MKGRLASVIVLALFSYLLAFPADMAAKGRRGAEIIVSRLDGSDVKGELVAVKPDSLLLLSEGRDVSIGLAEVRSLVIVRKSKSGLLAGIGGGAGAAAGATFGAYAFKSGGDDEPSSLRNGLIFGGLGALAGLLANSVLTLDSRFDVAGKPEADAARFWDRLSAHSREGARPKIAPADAPARPAGAAPPAAAGPPAKIAPRPAERPAPAPPRPSTRGDETSGRRKGRFRLSVSGALPLSISNTAPDEMVGYGSFSFPDQAAPESGPYVCGLNGWSSSGPVRIGLGPVALAYAWTPHVSVDAEFFTFGQASCRWDGGLGFTSSLDGRDFATYFGQGYGVRFSSILLGLSFHPLVPDSLQPHDIEIGAAAGPVWIKGAPFSPGVGGPSMLPSVGKASFAGRIQAAYGFSVTPTLSLGLFAGYRLMETRLAGITASGNVAFWESGDPTQTAVFQRRTEVALPPLTARATGPYAGLRLAFRI
ncbi:MAG TPA: hypothetical protein VLJ16_06620 [Acidobacteriota bacterium]|nr:hypothetical protein [Acidobacteriota bacterium]